MGLGFHTAGLGRGILKVLGILRVLEVLRGSGNPEGWSPGGIGSQTPQKEMSVYRDDPPKILTFRRTTLKSAFLHARLGGEKLTKHVLAHGGPARAKRPSCL